MITYGRPPVSGKGSRPDRYGCADWRPGSRIAVLRVSMVRPAASAGWRGEWDSVEAPSRRRDPADQASAVDTSDPQGVRSVQRAVDILALLTEDRPTLTVR